MYILRGAKRLLIVVLVFANVMTYSADIIGPKFISSDELPVTLSLSGQVYALSENVTGAITIAADDITLNLNGFVMTGQLIINGNRAWVYGGRIIAPAPVSNVVADAGVVQVMSGADNAQITDCFISASDTTVAGVRGSLAFSVSGDDCYIAGCTILGGNAGGINGNAGGGAGLFLFGMRPVVNNCQVEGGKGSDSTNGTITVGGGGNGFSIMPGVDGAELLSSTFFAGNAGTLNPTNSVAGVTLNPGGQNSSSGTNLVIRDCKVYGGGVTSITTTGLNVIGFVGGPVTISAGLAGLALLGATSSALIYNSDIRGGAVAGMNTFLVAEQNAVTQGDAGQGIYCEGNLVIENSLVTGGQAGSVTAGTIGESSPVNFGSGGIGIQIQSSSQRVIINHSVVSGSSASALTAEVIADLGNVIFGTGGDGIAAAGAVLTLYNVAVRGGDSNSTTITPAGGDIGSSTASVTVKQGGNGLTLSTGIQTVKCEQCSMQGGNVPPMTTTLGGVSRVLGSAGGAGVAVGYTATNFEQSLFINCNVSGGSGGNIQAQHVGGLGTVTASDGGNGYYLFASNASNIDITGGTITTLNGGKIIATLSSGFSANGGNGGTGINITGSSITGVRIHNVSIVATGNGGSGSVVVAGTNGNGGTGIVITQTDTKAEISNNIICYTGAGGAGTVPGSGGQAIHSLSTSSGMIVYGNYAHNIANATAYLITAGNIVETGGTAGTPYALAAGLNFLFNIHKP